MSYRRNAGGGRRDIAEGPICEALDGVGAEYWLIGGRGNPDILVRFRGREQAAEIKTGKGKETKNQGDFQIWRTPQDALRAIGAIQ